MNDPTRYTLNCDPMDDLTTYNLPPVPGMIFWFLKAYELQHGRGATAAEVAAHVGRDPAQVNRAWRVLERAGLVVIEARLSNAGKAIKNAS